MIERRSNKKAQSGVLITGLLILLVIIIAGISLSYASRYLEKQKEQQKGFSYNYKINLKNFEISNDNKKATIILTREDNEGDIYGAKLVFENNKGDSYDYTLIDESLNKPGMIISKEINANEIEGLEDFSNIGKVSVYILYNPKMTTGIKDSIDKQ